MLTVGVSGVALHVTSWAGSAGHVDGRGVRDNINVNGGTVGGGSAFQFKKLLCFIDCEASVEVNSTH